MNMSEETVKTIENAMVPAEWEAQDCLWVGWPSHADLGLWPGAVMQHARAEISAMILAVAVTQKIKVLTASTEAFDSAKTILNHTNVDIILTRFGDIWLRDTGPIFNADGTALRFSHNGWGGKFCYKYDDVIGDELARIAEAPIRRFDFILEGGAVEHNGAGVILTTRQCVLNDNRNSGWDEDTAEAALKDAFGASRICWLDEGLMNDHTDGHIDNIARFIGENHVVCQKAFGADDPNAALYETIANDLKSMGFEVTQIPSPGKVIDEDGEIVPASHMNFVIANDVVVVPTYGTASADAAVAALAALFPDRKVIGASSNAVLTGGGSFHCITQQQPSLTCHPEREAEGPHDERQEDSSSRYCAHSE